MVLNRKYSVSLICAVLFCFETGQAAAKNVRLERLTRAQQLIIQPGAAGPLTAQQIQGIRSLSAASADYLAPFLDRFNDHTFAGMAAALSQGQPEAEEKARTEVYALRRRIESRQSSSTDIQDVHARLSRLACFDSMLIQSMIRNLDTAKTMASAEEIAALLCGYRRPQSAPDGGVPAVHASGLQKPGSAKRVTSDFRYSGMAAGMFTGLIAAIPSADTLDYTSTFRHGSSVPVIAMSVGAMCGWIFGSKLNRGRNPSVLKRDELFMSGVIIALNVAILSMVGYGKFPLVMNAVMHVINTAQRLLPSMSRSAAEIEAYRTALGAAIAVFMASLMYYMSAMTYALVTNTFASADRRKVWKWIAGLAGVFFLAALTYVWVHHNVYWQVFKDLAARKN